MYCNKNSNYWLKKSIAILIAIIFGKEVLQQYCNTSCNSWSRLEVCLPCI